MVDAILFGVNPILIWNVLYSITVLLVIVTIFFDAPRKLVWRKLSEKKVPNWLKKSIARMGIYFNPQKEKYYEEIFDGDDVLYKARLERSNTEGIMVEYFYSPKHA